MDIDEAQKRNPGAKVYRVGVDSVAIDTEGSFGLHYGPYDRQEIARRFVAYIASLPEGGLPLYPVLTMEDR